MMRGNTWKLVPKQPTKYRPNHAVLASDGNLFITYGTDPGPMQMEDGAVWKLDTRSGAWTDITPDKPDQERKFGYAAVSVDARNPKVLIATLLLSPQGRRGLPQPRRRRDVEARSSRAVASSTTRSRPTSRTRPSTGCSMSRSIPRTPDHAMFTTGYGGWETYDLTNVDKNLPTHWSVMSPGIEETVALALYSPSKGAHVVTAVGDYSGFVHRDLDKPAPDGNPKPPFLGNTHDVSGGELQPERDRPRRPPARGTGRSATPWMAGRPGRNRRRCPTPWPRQDTSPSPPTARTWVWTPNERVPYVTSDKGASWTACAGLPKDTRVVADRVNPKRFYGIALFDGKLFESVDGAAKFTERPLVLPGGLPKRGGSGKDNRTDRGDDRGGQDRIYATPGRQGDLWLAAYDGLYHAPAGKEFVRIAGVEQIHGFGFGKAAPERRRTGRRPRSTWWARCRGSAASSARRTAAPPGCASTTISTSGGWYSTSPAIPRSSGASTSAPTAAARSTAIRRDASPEDTNVLTSEARDNRI